MSSEISVLSEVSERNLYEDLLTQINKDFNFAGLSIQFSVVPEELLLKLVEVISVLMKDKFEDYLNLLYRIDVSEKQIKAITQTDIDAIAFEVAVLILKRECQKVLLRNRF